MKKKNDKLSQAITIYEIMYAAKRLQGSQALNKIIMPTFWEYHHRLPYDKILSTLHHNQFWRQL